MRQQITNDSLLLSHLLYIRIYNAILSLLLFVALYMVGNTPISSEVSAQIVAYRDCGLTKSDISQRLGVAQSVVSRCLKRYGETGSHSHRKSPGRDQQVQQLIASSIALLL